MDDDKIIELFFLRSEEAIGELSKKYGGKCFKVAHNVLGDRRDSEECVNDAYLGVWNSVPPERPDPLLSYVCRIVRNLALKKYHENTAKKRNSNYDVALDEISGCFPSSSSVEDELESGEIAAAIGDFLGSLGKDDRIMFVRRYWYADTPGEIAALFGKSGHFVSVRLSRIRKALKKHLAEKGVTL